VRKHAADADGGPTAAALLFGLKAYDPLSLTFAALSLALVAAAASYVPARRTASVDPATALRRD
jgi:putative ABC transport system permease protein